MTSRIAIALDRSLSRTGHFGHASCFGIYEIGATGPRFIERRSAHPFCGQLDPQDGFLGRVLEALKDCALVSTSAIGPCGRTALEEQGIRVHLVEGSVEDAVASATRASGAGLFSEGGAA